MLHTDFHTHTTFCDGKSTPREMVEAAYRMGMTDFGVSGHADFSMFEPGFGMDNEKLRQYTEELQELREEYRGKMNLYIGIELDGLGPVQKAEYAIGSTHALIKDGEYVCVDDTEEKLTSTMTEQLHWDMTSAQGTPVRMAFAADSRRLAVAAVTSSAGQLQANLFVLSLAQGDPVQLSSGDSVPQWLGWLNNDTVLAVWYAGKFKALYERMRPAINKLKNAIKLKRNGKKHDSE